MYIAPNCINALKVQVLHSQNALRYIYFFSRERRRTVNNKWVHYNIEYANTKSHNFKSIFIRDNILIREVFSEY